MVGIPKNQFKYKLIPFLVLALSSPAYAVDIDADGVDDSVDYCLSQPGYDSESPDWIFSETGCHKKVITSSVSTGSPVLDFDNSTISYTQSGGNLRFSISDENYFGCAPKGELTCYPEFDLTAAPYLSQEGNTFTVSTNDVVTDYPTNTISYRLYANDRDGQKVYLSDWQNVEFDIQAPPLTDIESVVLNTVNGEVATSYVTSPFDDFKDLEVNLSQRSYDQLASLSIDGGSELTCVVVTGETSCTIPLDLALVNTQGQLDIEVNAKAIIPDNPDAALTTEANYQRSISYDFIKALQFDFEVLDVLPASTTTFTPFIDGLSEDQTYEVVFNGLPDSVSISRVGQTDEYTITTDADFAGNAYFSLEMVSSDGRTLTDNALISAAALEQFNDIYLPIVDANDQEITDGFTNIFAANNLPNSGVYTTKVIHSGGDGIFSINGQTIVPGQILQLDINYFDGVPDLLILSDSSNLSTFSTLKFIADSKETSFILPIRPYSLISSTEPFTGPSEVKSIFGQPQWTLGVDCRISSTEQELIDYPGSCVLSIDTDSPNVDFYNENPLTKRILANGLPEGEHSITFNAQTSFANVPITVSSTIDVVATENDVAQSVNFGFIKDTVDYAKETDYVEIAQPESDTFSCNNYSTHQGNASRFTAPYLIEQNRGSCNIVWTDIPVGMSNSDKYPERLVGSIDFNSYTSENPPTASYRVELNYETTPEPIVISEGTTVIDQLLPEAPQISIKPLTRDVVDQGDSVLYGEIDDLTFRVYGQVGSLDEESGKIINNGGDYLVSFNDQSGNKVSDIKLGYRNDIRYIPMPESHELGQRISYSIDASYASVPFVKAQKDVELVVVPNPKMRFFSEVKNVPDDVSPISVSVRAANSRFDETYTEGTHGKWLAYLTDYQRNIELSSGDTGTTYQPVSDVVEINDANPIPEMQFTANKAGVNRYFLTTEFKDDTGVSAIIKSKAAVLSVNVLKATDIEGALLKKVAVGYAPFKNIFKFKPNSTVDIKAIQSITWLVAQAAPNETINDVTFEPVKTIEGYRGSVYLHDFADEGIFFTKAVITTNGGHTFETEAVKTISTSRMNVEIADVRYLIPNSQKDISFTIDGEVPDPQKYEWEWTLKEDKSTDLTYTLDTGEMGSRHLLYLKVWNKAAGPGETLTTKTYRKLLSVGLPEKLPIKIVGSNMIEEFDGTVSYDTVGQTIDPGYGIPILTEWELPDGTIVPGDTLSLSPQFEDIGKKSYIFRAWFEGHKERAASKRHYISVFTTKVPNFNLSPIMTSQFVPAILTIRSAPDRRVTSTDLRSYTYEWEFDETQFKPLNVTNSYIRGFKVTEGDTTFKYKVTSEDGQDTKESEITVGATGQLLTTLNIYARAITEDTFEFRFSPRTLTSKDKIKNFTVKLNGNELTQEDFTLYYGRYRSSYSNGVSTNTLEITVETEWGYTLTESVEFSPK